MTLLEIVLTETTCGEACWKAREDVCRCSCGGKNHGCAKTADGVKPDRTAKIDGFRYILKAVGRPYYDGLNKQARDINQASPKHINNFSNFSYPYRHTEKGAPARIKRATNVQVAKWPELQAYQNATYRDWPYLLWVKIESATETK
jgi:hypothetical protein